MLLFEIKKVILKPLNKAALVILGTVLIMTCFLTIRDVKYVDDNGNTTSGIMAARHLKSAKDEWKGYITEDKLKKIIKDYKAINSSEEALAEDEQENDKAYAKIQGYSDLINMINLAFSEFDNFNSFKINNVSVEEVGDLLVKRTDSLKEWLYKDEIKNNFSKKEKSFIIDRYESLKSPLYYESAEGWKALLDSQYLPTLMMITILIMGLFISGIFSDEFTLKSDSIFFSTKLGRNRAIVSKIGAGFFVITSIYWGVILLYSIVILGSLGWNGSSCAIQTGLSNWKSFYNISYLQDYFLTVLGGYVGCLFILTFSMLISAKTRSTVLAITVPFILVCIPPFLGKITLFSRLVSLFPDRLLRLNKSLEDFSLYHIGGKIFGSISIIIPIYLILFCIILPILYHVYRKTEIK